MGSGASTLSNEQKATIAKEMKEKYESLDPAEQLTAQANLLKHYEELVAKCHADGDKKEEQTTIGLPPVKKLKNAKKKLGRLRSFENGNFLLENVAHAKKETEAPDQDFWDSVSTQPTCLVCKMVFSTESKRDTHMKYSEVHAKNVEALQALEKLNGRLDESSDQKKSPVNTAAPEAPSFRCRELYSGSKFYWRLQDTIEYHLFLHLEGNIIEVIPYDNHSQKEYDRLYFDENKVHTLVGPEKIVEKVKARLAECEKDCEKTGSDKSAMPKEEDLMADERRQFVVSFLMSKLQLSIPDAATGTKVVEFKMTVDPMTTPLFASAPASVKPVLVKRRRLSTTAEIEQALLQATDLELEINTKLQEAEQLENLAHGS